MYTFRTLAGEFTVPVANREPQTLRAAVAQEFKVDPRRVERLIDDLYIIQPPFYKKHEPLDPEYRSPPGYVELLEQHVHKLRPYRKSICANPGLTDLVLRHPELIDWEALARNPNPRAVDQVYLARGGRAWRNYGLNQTAVAFMDVNRMRDLRVWAELCANPAAVELVARRTDVIDWAQLSANPNALPLLEQHPDKIRWSVVCRQPHVDFFARHLDKVDWRVLSGNPAAVDLCAQHLDQVDWRVFSENPAAVKVLAQYPERVNWCAVCRNPAAIDLIQAHLDLIDPMGWYYLSRNPAAVPLLAAHLDRVHLRALSANPAALELLQACDPDQLDWTSLSSNPCAVPLLAAHVDRVDWMYAARNPAALELLAANVHRIGYDRTFTPGFLDSHKRCTWYDIVREPNFIPLLAAHPDLIPWADLCATYHHWTEYIE